MHLNQLYGYFGRSLKLFHTENVNLQELKEKLTTNVINSILKINNDLYIALMSTNLSENIIQKLNITLDHKLETHRKKVRANVAIAPAVTSYAQLEMAKLKVLCDKLGINILYTDTDSAITDKPLPGYLIGDDIGLLKDELNGGLITKGYF